MGAGYEMESTTLGLGGGFDIRKCKSGLKLHLRFRVQGNFIRLFTVIIRKHEEKVRVRIYLVFRVIVGVGYKWKTRYLGIDTQVFNMVYR